MENENAEGTTDFYAHDNTVERLGANGVATGNENSITLVTMFGKIQTKMASKTRMNMVSRV